MVVSNIRRIGRNEVLKFGVKNLNELEKIIDFENVSIIQNLPMLSWCKCKRDVTKNLVINSKFIPPRELIDVIWRDTISLQYIITSKWDKPEIKRNNSLHLLLRI